TDSLPYVARDGIHRFDTEAILGHELRSRLAPMKHAAELLKGESVDAPTRWHIAGTIDRQLGAMTRLIEDLLYSSPRRISELAMRCSVVPLSEVIECTLEIVRTIVSARN